MIARVDKNNDGVMNLTKVQFLPVNQLWMATSAHTVSVL